MSILNRLKETSEGNATEELKDVTGGGIIKESGIYDLTIQRAYFIESGSSDAIGVKIDFVGEGFLDYQTYISRADGSTTFNKNGKDIALPSYAMMKKINYVISGKFGNLLDNIDVEEKVIKVKEFSNDVTDENGNRKLIEVEKSVEMITSWIDAKIKVAVRMGEKEKREKNDSGSYVGTGHRAEDKDGNPYLDAELMNVYNMDGKTASEILNDKEPKAIIKDRDFLEKNPIKVFKAKGAKKSSGGGSPAKPSKPAIF